MGVYVLSHFSHVRLFVRLWTAVCQAPLSMGFFRQGYQSGLSFPPPRDLPDPGIEPMSLRSPALASGFFTTSSTQEPQNLTNLDTTFYINLVQYIQKSILRFFSLICMLLRSILFNIKMVLIKKNQSHSSVVTLHICLNKTIHSACINSD